MTAVRLARDEIDRENAALRRLVTAYQHLSSLAVQDTDLDTLTASIAARVDTAVAVVDDKLSLLSAAASDLSPEDAAHLFVERLRHPRLTQVLGVVGPARRALRLPDIAGAPPVIVAPIPVGDAVPAYLLTVDDDGPGGGEDFRLFLTEHAATICGVILSRERVTAAAATQARYDLVEGLLSGKGSEPGEVRRWAAHLGYDEQQDHRVVSLVVEADGELTGRAAAAVERFFTTQVPEAITAVRGGEVVLVVGAAGPVDPRANTLATGCIDRVKRLFPDAVLTAGVGRNCRPAEEIAASYDDARRTVAILGRMGRTGVAAAIEDLGIHRLLLQVADSAQLKTFARDVFGEVLTSAKGHGREYLPTLACYFRANNSPQRASTDLHVHPNTVTYRVRRVEELTGLDFRNYRDRLMAQVALEILDVVGDTL